MSTAEDVYHPEWLAYEEILGSRPALTGNIEQDIATFDQMGAYLATQWPLVQEPLTVSEEIIEPENIRVRIYKSQPDETNNLPTMVYFHGGGFISGDLETEDPLCRRIAARTPCNVVNVDYPLAPKHDMDHIIESGLRAIEWVRSHNPPLTTSTTILLGGGSAGASLATQLTYHFTSQNDNTAISGLLIINPIASPAAHTPYSGKYSEIHTSAKDKAEGAPFLNREAMLNMMKLPKMNATLPKHFPLLANKLTGFPKTYIVTGEHDPARDDGVVLAKRLVEESQVEVIEMQYQGMPHWFQWFPAVPTAHVMMDKTVMGVKWILGQGSGEGAGTLLKP